MITWQFTSWDNYPIRVPKMFLPRYSLEHLIQGLDGVDALMSGQMHAYYRRRLLLVIQICKPQCWRSFVWNIVYCTETSPVKKPAAEKESGSAAASERGVGTCMLYPSYLNVYTLHPTFVMPLSISGWACVMCESSIWCKFTNKKNSIFVWK